MQKKQVYKLVRIWGLLSFIPFVMVAGPLSGVIIGGFLEKKFRLPFYVSIITIGFGFVVSVTETVRIIKLVSNTDKKWTP